MVRHELNTKKKIVLALVILFAGHISLSGSAYALEDPQVFYSMDYGGLLIEVEAPAIAWPGDYINLTLRAAASAISCAEVSPSSSRNAY